MNDVFSAISALLGSAPNSIKERGVTRFSTSEMLSNRDGWVIRIDGHSYRFGCWRQNLKGSFYEEFSNSFAFKSVEKNSAKILGDISNDQARVRGLNAKNWDQAQPITKAKAVAKYFKKRGLEPLIFPLQIREGYLDYYEDGVSIGKFQAMIAIVTNPELEAVALHRTYLTPDGDKASVAQVKKLSRTSGHLSGASIKLGEMNSIKGRLTLGVAEGIETAIACSLASGITTWSCLSAGLMQQFQWPKELESLVIFGDNDKSGVGQEAAFALARRAISFGLECRVLIPDQEGKDWLDVYLAG